MVAQDGWLTGHPYSLGNDRSEVWLDGSSGWLADWSRRRLAAQDGRLIGHSETSAKTVGQELLSRLVSLDGLHVKAE
jgi:hypothetical protein